MIERYSILTMTVEIYNKLNTWTNALKYTLDYFIYTNDTTIYKVNFPSLSTRSTIFYVPS